MSLILALTGAINNHLQVMLYWITITDGRLRAIPPGLKNRVTDNSLCHQERQINVPISTPAAASENRSSLPPGGTTTNSISVITHTEPPQRARLSGAAVSTGLQRWGQPSSRRSLHYIKQKSTCLYILGCVIPRNCRSSTGQKLVCVWALSVFSFSFFSDDYVHIPRSHEKRLSF